MVSLRGRYNSVAGPSNISAKIEKRLVLHDLRKMSGSAQGSFLVLIVLGLFTWRCACHDLSGKTIVSIQCKYVRKTCFFNTFFSELGHRMYSVSY